MSIRTAFSVCAWGFLVSFPIPRSLHAATRTDAFGVTVMVQDSCVASLNRSTAQTNSNQGALLNGASAVSVTCGNLTRYEVTLSMEPQVISSGTAAAPALPASAPISLPPGRADKHRALAGAGSEISQPPAGDSNSSPQRAAPNAHTVTVTVTY